jgi:hypothetical protein
MFLNKPSKIFFLALVGACSGISNLNIDALALIGLAAGAFYNLLFNDSYAIFVAGGLLKNLVNGALKASFTVCGPQSLFCGLAAFLTGWYYIGWMPGQIVGLVVCSAFFFGSMTTFLCKNYGNFTSST